MEILRFLAFVVSSLLVMGDIGAAGGIDEEALSVLLLHKAAAGDTEGIIGLEAQAISSPADRYAYHLARYIADPGGYADAFVREFPATPGGVMGIVYSIELEKDKDGKQLTPGFLYSFRQLGNLAIEGNAEAVGKLYLSTVYSDGADGWRTTAPVGALAGCEGPKGVRDLVGNVAEWCRRDGTRYETRGGSWRSPPAFLRPFYVNLEGADRRDPTIGFRLVYAPGRAQP